MPRKEKLSMEVKVRLTKTDLERLDSLAVLCNMTRAEMLRECLTYSAGAVRKAYIKEFVKKAKAMPDPFGEVDDSIAQQTMAMANTIDDSDREMADRYERLLPKPTKEDLEEEARWWKESETLVN